MIYCRIKLQETNYKETNRCKVLWSSNHRARLDTDKLLEIYNNYCKHKKFKSPWPYYKEQFTQEHFELLGYYNDDQLVAWSLIYIINEEVVEAFQFAWDYKNPELRLGILSLTNECAMYKKRGFKYILLGEADDYKKEIKGFEIIK